MNLPVFMKIKRDIGEKRTVVGQNIVHEHVAYYLDKPHNKNGLSSCRRTFIKHKTNIHVHVHVCTSTLHAFK